MHDDEGPVTDELLATFRGTYRWKRLVLEHCTPASVCALCGGDRGPILFGLRPNHPLGPSLDHVLPAARCTAAWQLWEPSNLQPAHFGCNAGKRDRVPDRVANRRGWTW